MNTNPNVTEERFADADKNSLAYKIFTKITEISNEFPDTPIHSSLVSMEVVRVCEKKQDNIIQMIHPEHKENDAGLVCCEMVFIFKDKSFLRVVQIDGMLSDMTMGRAALTEEDTKQLIEEAEKNNTTVIDSFDEFSLARKITLH